MAAQAFKATAARSKHGQFSSMKPPHKQGKDKEIKLTPELEEKFRHSGFGKIPEALKPKDLNNAMKSVFVFKDYLVPNKRVDPVFASLIKKSYFYLVLSKVA